MKSDRKVTLRMLWEGPVTWSQRKQLPTEPGVYVILIEEDDGLKLARIGTTGDLSKRPYNYGAAPKEIETKLRVVWAKGPLSFKNDLQQLLTIAYPDRKIGHLQGWIERKLLDEYKKSHTNSRGKEKLPPGNAKGGYIKKYLAEIELEDGSPWDVRTIKAANLDKKIRKWFRKHKKSSQKKFALHQSTDHNLP